MGESDQLAMFEMRPKERASRNHVDHPSAAGVVMELCDYAPPADFDRAKWVPVVVAALREVGVPAEIDPQRPTAVLYPPWNQEEAFKAFNLIRRRLGFPEFPDFPTMHAYTEWRRQQP